MIIAIVVRMLSALVQAIDVVPDLGQNYTLVKEAANLKQPSSPSQNV